MLNLKEKYREKDERSEQMIKEVFEFKNETAPYMISDPNYWLFGELPEDIPDGYCGDDPQVMLDYQVAKIERHYNTPEFANDCYEGFLMPWFGTGVLASGFGTEITFGEKMDPAVNMSKIKDPSEIDALVMPDPNKSGLMPQVLKHIDYFKSHCDLPIGVTDCQGPLTTALSIIGYENYIYWAYDYPEQIHKLMQMSTDALISWIKEQKRHIGVADEEPGYLLGAHMPKSAGGVWIADDDSVIMNADLFAEFVKPYNEQVMLAFGGGGIHYCGCSNQNIQNYMDTKGLNCLHNLHLDHFEQVEQVRRACLENGKAFMTGDFVGANERLDGYFDTMYGKLEQKGMMVVSYPAPAIALDQGMYTASRRDQMELGKRVAAIIEEKKKKYF